MSTQQTEFIKIIVDIGFHVEKGDLAYGQNVFASMCVMLVFTSIHCILYLV